LVGWFPADKKTFAQRLIFRKHFFNLFSSFFTVQKEAEQWDTGNRRNVALEVGI
jgi:hypothetical protein